MVVAHDRNGQVLSEVAGKGRITVLEIDTVLDDYLDDSVLLCTDTATNYKKFAAMKGLKHEAINALKRNMFGKIFITSSTLIAIIVE